jgi:hypothetical protein
MDDYIDDDFGDDPFGDNEPKPNPRDQRASHDQNKSSINRLPTISKKSTVKQESLDIRKRDDYEEDEDEWGDNMEDPIFADPNRNNSTVGRNEQSKTSLPDIKS